MNAVAQALWRIAPMSPEHLPQVLRIERAGYDFPWTEGIFSDCIRVGYSSWVLRNTVDEVLGYALMSLAVDEAHVLNICTAPSCRRQGAASFLMRHLLQIATAAGLDEMLLEVRRSNTAALALYQALDFRQIAVRKGYYPAGDEREDALLLSRRLQP